MATVKNNIVTQGLSGKLGGTLVFRQVNGRTIVATAPTQTATEVTEKQIAQRRRFSRASAYAKAQMQDPDARAMYEVRGNSADLTAYVAALTDYLTLPTVDGMDLTAYQGKVGDAIRVQASDDCEVVSVWVRIENGDGSVVEEGSAVLQPNGLDWLYSVRVRNADLTGDRVQVRVTDRPGNQTEDFRIL